MVPAYSPVRREFATLLFTSVVAASYGSMAVDGAASGMTIGLPLPGAVARETVSLTRSAIVGEDKRRAELGEITFVSSVFLFKRL
jgi:hypothetical protein